MSPRIRTCQVESCDYKSSKGFSNLPSDETFRKQWIDILQLQKVTAKMYICHRHFIDTDFTHSRDDGRLRFGVVPQNLPPAQRVSLTVS